MIQSGEVENILKENLQLWEKTCVPITLQYPLWFLSIKPMGPSLLNYSSFLIKFEF